MKLKKWMFTLIALLATNSLFANNAFDLKEVIMYFFGSPEKVVQKSEVQGTVGGVKLSTVSTALKTGLLQYEQELSSGQLTQTSQNLYQEYQNLIQVVNQIQESSKEVMTEIYPIVARITEDVLQLQKEVPDADIDTNLARHMMMLFLYMNLIYEDSDTVTETAKSALWQDTLEMTQYTTDTEEE